MELGGMVHHGTQLRESSYPPRNLGSKVNVNVLSSKKTSTHHTIRKPARTHSSADRRKRRDHETTVAEAWIALPPQRRTESLPRVHRV